MVKLKSLIIMVLLIVIALLISSRPVSVKYSAKNFSCGGVTCNVIFIVNDTLAASHLSLYGYERNTSPFVDEYFGKGGVVFKNMSSNAPWTLASFASFFTSQYPSDIKLETYQDKLDSNIPAFTNILDRGGVDTAAFYLGDGKSGVFSRFPPANSTTAEDPLTYDLALSWIKSRPQSTQKPFFVMVHNRIVHEPYDPPREYRSLFSAPAKYPGPVDDTELDQANKNPGGVTTDQRENFIRQYDQEIRYVDDLTKKFIGGLPKEVLDHSVIIFTADHGEGFGEHGRYGHANSLYGELLDVPLFVKGPGLRSLIVNQPVSLLDLGPTIVDILGLSRPANFQGQSLLPLLKGETVSEEVVRSELAYKVWPDTGLKTLTPVIRTTPLKDRGYLSLRRGDWKLIQNPDLSLELYNLKNDPGERVNLIDHKGSLSAVDLAVVDGLIKGVIP